MKKSDTKEHTLRFCFSELQEEAKQIHRAGYLRNGVGEAVMGRNKRELSRVMEMFSSSIRVGVT